MRILNIIQRYPPAVGGSETWAQEVCRYLAGRGHHVTVFTMNVNREEEFWREPAASENTTAFGRYENDRGVHVHRFRRSLPIHSIHHLIFGWLLDRIMMIYFYGPHSVELYGRIWDAVRKSDLVLLHTIPYPHNIIGWFAAKWHHKKVVIVPHFHPSHPHYERWSNYLLMKSCDAVLTVSSFEKTYLAGKGIPADRLFVTGNGVHPELYEPADGVIAVRLERFGIQENERVVLFLGRKMPDKGVDTLIEAVRRLHGEIPVKLLLAGPAFSWFEQLYSGLSQDERTYIIDLGVVSHEEKAALLRRADLLALPSRYEAFGIVFLEAWICGTPVLGTYEGAMPGVIGEEGFLARYGDADDLHHVLRDALSDPKRLRAMGERGRQKVHARFTWPAIGAEVEKALRVVFPKTKVLMVANAYPPNFIGGAELIAHHQAVALKNAGCDVAVFAGDPDQTSERYGMRKDNWENIPVSRVTLHAEDYSADFTNYVHTAVEERFLEVLDEFAPDVVHFHNLAGLSAGMIGIAKRRGCKTVLTLHDYWGFCMKNTLLRENGSVCSGYVQCAECNPEHAGFAARLRSDYLSRQFDSVDRFISPSKFLASEYVRAGFPEDRFSVVWNGIDTGSSAINRDGESATFRFSYIGYLGPHKGIATILDALQLLTDSEHATLNIVGGGDQHDKLQAMVASKGLETRVRFWGKISNSRIADVYRQTDALILPSVWPENQPVTITEAMAARIPVIASNIGGIPEIVEDGVTGLLFEPGNAGALAAAMRRCLEAPEECRAMGRRGAERMVHNSYTKSAAALQQIYRDSSSSQATCNTIIACAGGDSLRPGLYESLARSLRTVGNRRVLFLMVDWLTEADWKDVALLLVANPHLDMNVMVNPLWHGVPLVVPANHEELARIVTKYNCGAVYTSSERAEAAIRSMLENPEGTDVMARNALRALYA